MEMPIHWFEIPVADLDRASHFYTEVFGCTLRQEAMGDVRMAIFPYRADAPGGALCQHPLLTPGRSGTLPYLEGGEDLAVPLQRARALGATLVMEKTSLGEIGSIAMFEDSEGNLIGLHSPH